MKDLVFIFQGALQIFVGLGAGVCGALLIIDPSGSALQMSLEMLRNSAFDDFLIPGVILFLINGIGQLIARLLTLKRNRFSGYLGAAFGVALMIWIFVQVNMINSRHILQYAYFMIGALETVLAFLIHGQTWKA